MLVDVAEVKKILKDTYLDIANSYTVSDLLSDSDKVACVASAFRQSAADRLDGLSVDIKRDDDGTVWNFESEYVIPD